MPNELKFQVQFRVPPRLMYEALTNQLELSKFTHSLAKFDKSVGGTFSLYDGFITGENEELVENKKIVQKWKFSNWKDTANLTLTFKEKDGNECLIIAYMKNIPERDNSGVIVDLKELEKGFRTQIFQKISDWLGYPQNNDKEDSDEDEN